MKKHVVGSFVLALLFLSVPAFAQNPFVGTWEIVSSTQDGKEMTPSLPAGIQPGVPNWMFTVDGFYMAVMIPKGRPQLATTRDKWTSEEFHKIYDGTGAQYGTYSVSGDKLTMRPISALGPENEGKEFVWSFRKDGADLIATTTGTNGSKIEVRLRRAK